MTPANGECVVDSTNNRYRVGDGARLGGFPVPNFSDVQRNAFTRGVVGGTANAITLTHTPASLSDTGLSGNFIATANNTTAATLAVDGRSAAALRKLEGGSIVELEANDIVAGGYYDWARVGSVYIITTGISPVVPPAGWSLISIATGGGSFYDFSSGINSNYRNYAFVLEKVISNSNSTVDFMIRTGAGSYSGSGYAWARRVVNSTGVGADGASGSDSGIRVFANLVGQVNGGQGVSGIVYANGLAQANFAPFEFQCSAVQSIGSPNFYASKGCGMLASGAAMDRVGFLFSADGIASGSIYMYGMNSSL